MAIKHKITQKVCIAKNFFAIARVKAAPKKFAKQQTPPIKGGFANFLAANFFFGEKKLRQVFLP